jgi:release factor glutamine methyltransferase
VRSLGLAVRTEERAPACVRVSVRAAAAALAAAGCESPRLDAELLIADALGVERSALFSDPGRAIPAPLVGAVAERIERRAAREPVA